MKRILFVMLAALSFSAARAKLILPSLIADNMVLQQQTDVMVWGWATPGTRVTVKTSWSENTYVGRVDTNGKWFIAFPTPAANFDSHSLTISEVDSNEKTKSKKTTKKAKSTYAMQMESAEAEGTEITIRNILIGEVWLASGQSNMQMPLKGFPGCCVQNGTSDAMHAMQESPYVRMFKVPMAQSYEPLDSCAGTWDLPTFRNALEFSATAYYFATSLSNALQVPVGIVNSSYGGSRVESWMSMDLLKKYNTETLDRKSIESVTPDYTRPLLMYNAMFSPIKNYTYKGIIWYQGCSNVGHADVYAQRLADMVKLWRTELDLGTIPFYFVELAPYIYGSDGYAGNSGVTYGASTKNQGGVDGALLREAQFKAQYLIPNSDIVSINDLAMPYEVYNIHPSQKRKVGERLCYVALNKTYGMSDIACSGPRFDKLRIKADTAVVSFKDLYMGICRNWDLQGFEIAGNDRKFYPAVAQFHWQTNEVTLTHDSVPHPVAVRYCFKDFQIGNLIGGNELPLFPFRTDNW